jgi:hypothetical protein
MISPRSAAAGYEKRHKAPWLRASACQKVPSGLFAKLHSELQNKIL